VRVAAVCTERLGCPRGWRSRRAYSPAVDRLYQRRADRDHSRSGFIVTLAGSIAYSGLLLFLMFWQTTLIIRNDFYIALAGST